MKFEFDNSTPIYLQLLEHLKIYIISGHIKPGEKLLSVRELALKIKVNPNTVQKALIELENLKLIYTERTNGKYVTNNKELINKLKNEYAKELSNKYFEGMQSIGFNREEATNYLKELGENK